MKSPQKRYRELRPIKESTKNYEKIEDHIKQVIFKMLLAPLLKELGVKRKALKNAPDLTGKKAFLEAISKGQITFYRGEVTGQFDAIISKELRAMGAVWDKQRRSFRINLTEVPDEIREAIRISTGTFQKRLAAIDSRLQAVSSQEIAAAIKVSDLFDKTLWQVEKDLAKTLPKPIDYSHTPPKTASELADANLSKVLPAISVPVQLTDKGRKKIADEYETNLQKDIKKWTDEQVIELRKHVQESAWTGNRRETLIDHITQTYGVAQRKAKFLARQETNLLMSKFKETRYLEAGVYEYRWATVHMPHDAPGQYHPGYVRHRHWELDGTIHRFDDPPVTTGPGEKVRRNNPGEDFNCRCSAIPLVKF